MASLIFSRPPALYSISRPRPRRCRKNKQNWLQGASDPVIAPEDKGRKGKEERQKIEQANLPPPSPVQDCADSGKGGNQEVLQGCGIARSVQMPEQLKFVDAQPGKVEWVGRDERHGFPLVQGVSFNGGASDCIRLGDEA